MIGSTTPVADQADWHPVHRANAMLRAALLSATHSQAPDAEHDSAELLSEAVESVMRGPVEITFPQPLAARLDALELEEDAFPAFERLMAKVTEPAWEEEDLPAPEELSPGAPLDPAWAAPPPQAHVQTLLQDFHRRQRNAGFLVAGSIAAAVVLTLGGLVLIANLAAPARVHGETARSTSVVWQPPADAGRVSVGANRRAKGAPLRLAAATDAPALPQARVILAPAGRQIAFAPLLPPSLSGYFLIRGLPAAAALSAGRRSDSGTWLVKADQTAELRLQLGAAAEGDYPIEIYLLRAGDAPQGRRSLVLRVEPGTPMRTAANPAAPWTSTLLGLVPAARAAEAPVPPAQSELLRARAQRLIDEGDIAAARLLLIHLAERGEGDAAYELGRTFDPEMLSALGARGIANDPLSARSWYERAAERGNAKAAARLKILASLSRTDQSD
jgi:TPR repeat protein